MAPTGPGTLTPSLSPRERAQTAFTATRLGRRVFGRERSEVLGRYTKRSFRFGGDEMTRMFVSTSGVINGAAVNIYKDRQEALQALLADRRGERTRRPSPVAVKAV